MGRGKEVRDEAEGGRNFTTLTAIVCCCTLGGTCVLSGTLRGVVLVNPATSFDRTLWNAVVPILSKTPNESILNGVELPAAVK